MNHQNIISEKDKQLVEFKKQIESLQKTESELSKLIEEQKAKNNVSSFSTYFPNLPASSQFIFDKINFSLYKTNNFLSLPSTKILKQNYFNYLVALKTGFAKEKLEVG